MGAASSVDLHAELARPADASDVETNDEARAEVARLRAMIMTPGTHTRGVLGVRCEGSNLTRCGVRYTLTWVLRREDTFGRAGVKVFGCDDSGSGGSDAGVRCEDAICRGC